ncbi:hypothetical protein EB233_18095 [Mesorhizobium erdmanii]|uniref:Uncharacterized protein n=2 Tax=Mesorhizobium erdmanii TaxID=1777866 RepID=A0A6M7UKA2_9HYPH|nr:hypothetical protein A8146_04715 [Mesorhizobium loti]QKC77176.1 hypothetical protein EB233_18095 [Mesorhizobium erdmanii]
MDEIRALFLTMSRLKVAIYGFTSQGFAIALDFTKYLTDWIVRDEKPQALEVISGKRFRGSIFN